MILSCQLCFTTAAIALVKSQPDLNEAMQGMGLFAIGAFIVSFIIEIVILCCRSCARKVPSNYFLLLIFTICQSFFFSYVCSRYPSETVLSAAGMTSVVTIALTFYACKTERDFTVCGSVFFLISIALLCLMVVSFLFT